jgi:guanylate kinase
MDWDFSRFNRLPFYDYFVVNDRVETAVAKLQAIIMAERCRVPRLLSAFSINFNQEEPHER